VASFKPIAGPITFGVTAVDELGNESDMVLLPAPYQFNVPEAPDDLHLQTTNEYYTSNVQQVKSNDDKEMNHDNPAEPKKLDNRSDLEKNNEGSDFSNKLNLIIEQAQKL
jgi:hypothetical protein